MNQIMLHTHTFKSVSIRPQLSHRVIHLRQNDDGA